jgi:NSS family neurotransmitter:Na+ symporter
MFEELQRSPLRQIVCHAFFIFLAIYIVSGGISRGIEKWNKILMPTLLGILLLLVLNSLFCPGAGEGIKFLFYPDFSKITPAAILEAMGQAFFSLSLGMGAMITYGSYLNRETNLMNVTIEVCALDTLVALVGGLVIFPIVFSYGLPCAAGPGLFFKTLPVVFSQLPGGRLVAILFFFLVAFAALTSAISLLEVVVSHFIDEIKWSRKKASFLMGFAIFLFGVPSALSSNILKGITFLGERSIFDSFDFLATNYMLPIGGLSIALFCGWFLSRKESMDEIEKGGNSFFFYRLWRFIIRYITPVAVSLVFLQKTGIINF